MGVLLKVSQEMDKLLDQYERGGISKDGLEQKRSELHRELQQWSDSLEDRKFW